MKNLGFNKWANKQEFNDNDSKIPKHSDRSDVIFKSIFRAIKKHYYLLFTQYWDANSITLNKMDKAKNLAIISKFIQACIVDEKSWPIFSKAELIDASHFIGKISFPEFVNKTSKNIKIVNEAKIFYECIYRFSRFKASKLYTSNTFVKIYRHFVKSGGMQCAIESDKSLSRHKLISFEKANKLLESIESSI